MRHAVHFKVLVCCSCRRFCSGVIIEMPDSDSDEDTDDEGLPKEAAMVSWYPSGMCLVYSSVPL